MTPVARTPILDIKETYSGAGQFETVQQVLATEKPLREQPGSQNRSSTLARVAPLFARALTTHGTARRRLTPLESSVAKRATQKLHEI